MDTGRISEGAGGSPGLVSSGSDKGEIRSVLAGNHIAYRGPPNHPYPVRATGFSLRFSTDLQGAWRSPPQSGTLPLEPVPRPRFWKSKRAGRDNSVRGAKART